MKITYIEMTVVQIKVKVIMSVYTPIRFLDVSTFPRIQFYQPKSEICSYIDTLNQIISAQLHIRIKLNKQKGA